MTDLRISDAKLEEINRFLMDEGNPLIRSIHALLEKYGGVEKINNTAKENGKLENLMA